MAIISKLIRDLETLINPNENDYIAIDRQSKNKTNKIALKDIDVGLFDNSKTHYRTECNFTQEDAEKLNNLTIDNIMSSTSLKPVANKIIKQYIDDIEFELNQKISNIPIKVEDSVNFNYIDESGIYLTSEMTFEELVYGSSGWFIAFFSAQTVGTQLVKHLVILDFENYALKKVKNNELVDFIEIDSEFSNSSTRPVQNKIIKQALDQKISNEDSVIITRNIANEAVTTEKIGEGQVYTNNIADEAITNDKILDNTISEQKLDSDLARKIKPSFIVNGVISEGNTFTIDSTYNQIYSAYAEGATIILKIDTLGDGSRFFEIPYTGYSSYDENFYFDLTLETEEEFLSAVFIISTTKNTFSINSSEVKQLKLISSGKTYIDTDGIRINLDKSQQPFSLEKIKLVLNLKLDTPITTSLRIRTNSGQRYLNYVIQEWRENTLVVLEAEYNSFTKITNSIVGINTSTNPNFQGTTSSNTLTFLNYSPTSVNFIKDIEIYFGQSMGTYQLAQDTEYELWGY